MTGPEPRALAKYAKMRSSSWSSAIIVTHDGADLEPSPQASEPATCL